MSQTSSLIRKRYIGWVALFLWFAVVLQHGLMPVKTDPTPWLAGIVACSLILVWHIDGSKLFSGLEWCAFFGALLFFIAVAVTTAQHPATIKGAFRAVLWAATVFSGVVLSRVFLHGYRYLAVLVPTLLLCVFAALVSSIVFGNAIDFWQDERLKLYAIHPSRLALYCAVAFFWCAGRLFFAPPKKEALFCIVGCASSFVLLLFTNTRTMVLLFPLGLLFLCVCAPKRLYKKLFLGGVLFCALATAGVFLGKDTYTGERIITAATNPQKIGSFVTRYPIWLAGWEAFSSSPYFGTGMRSYLDQHAKYVQANKDFLEKEHPTYEHTVKQAHNIVLGRMVETGAVGAIGFVIFYFAAIGCAFTGPKEHRWVAALLAYFFLVSMLDDPLFRLNDMLLLFVAGSAISLRRARPEVMLLTPRIGIWGAWFPQVK